ncbi:replicative helicase loader/inhibitor [Rossellomorea marisflavi]|uniref:replicative helicase loader/inhibitor n=1 Tax=Rossellomorea marisflavi TaxID=189381 RepID=UPI0028536AE0|nr:replicative helicase loader/inhibitor [Rossellomorea marisflavi]MDR4938210.1 replicative helicase loader/inhibitor [Rossellomorea marisflavi]
MTRDELGKVLERMQAAYPNQPLSRSMLEVWVEELKECTYERVQQRLTVHIRESRFLPSVSELYEEPVEEPVEETRLKDMILKWEKEGAERIEQCKGYRAVPPWE